MMVSSLQVKAKLDRLQDFNPLYLQVQQRLQNPQMKQVRVQWQNRVSWIGVAFLQINIEYPIPDANSDLLASTFEVTVLCFCVVSVFRRMFTLLVQVTLADQQGNPNSPLYSVKTFQELGLYVFLRLAEVSMMQGILLGILIS